MTLASLQNVPQSDHDWLIFAFANQAHHSLLDAALQKQKGVNNPPTVLDPIAFFDFENWLRRHAQSHSVYDQTLSILATDLTAVDIKDKEQLTHWVFGHWTAHQQEAAKLGVAQ